MKNKNDHSYEGRRRDELKGGVLQQVGKEFKEQEQEGGRGGGGGKGKGEGIRSHLNLMALDSLKLTYKDWQKDFRKAEDAHFDGNDQRFKRLVRTINKKQRVYDGDRTHPRLQALDQLILTMKKKEEKEEEKKKNKTTTARRRQEQQQQQDHSGTEELSQDGTAGRNDDDDNCFYPGFRDDFEKAENVHYDWEDDSNFYQILEGIENKQRLFRGDRSHPDIVMLDSIRFGYPLWEEDLEKAEMAHKCGNQCQFQRLLQMMRKKQQAQYLGDRTHPRLIALDTTLPLLSYPGLEEDIQKAENSHFEWEFDTEFYNFLQGMRHKQTAYEQKQQQQQQQQQQKQKQNQNQKQEHKQATMKKDNIPALVELHSLTLTYPGWERDYRKAEEAYYWEGFNPRILQQRLQKIKKQQRVYDGDRSHPQLVALDRMAVSYPGWENDVHEAEILHFNAWETDGYEFWNKLSGMNRKQQFYRGTGCPTLEEDYISYYRKLEKKKRGSTIFSTKKWKHLNYPPRHDHSMNQTKTKKSSSTSSSSSSSSSLYPLPTRTTMTTATTTTKTTTAKTKKKNSKERIKELVLNTYNNSNNDKKTQKKQKKQLLPHQQKERKEEREDDREHQQRTKTMNQNSSSTTTSSFSSNSIIESVQTKEERTPAPLPSVNSSSENNNNNNNMALTLFSPFNLFAAVSQTTEEMIDVQSSSSSNPSTSLSSSLSENKQKATNNNRNKEVVENNRVFSFPSWQLEQVHKEMMVAMGKKFSTSATSTALGDAKNDPKNATSASCSSSSSSPSSSSFSEEMQGRRRRQQQQQPGQSLSPVHNITKQFIRTTMDDARDILVHASETSGVDMMCNEVAARHFVKTNIFSNDIDTELY